MTEANRSDSSRSPAAAAGELVLTHMGLVRPQARKIARSLPRSIEIDDLIQAGMLGLVEAANHYDGSVPFSAYARLRVRGAILDFVRTQYQWAVDRRGLPRQMPAPDGAAGPRQTRKVRQLMRAVADLDPRQRQILQLMYARGETPAEIARQGLQSQRMVAGPRDKVRPFRQITSERRVQQIHKAALATLRGKLAA